MFSWRMAIFNFKTKFNVNSEPRFSPPMRNMVLFVVEIYVLEYDLLRNLNVQLRGSSTNLNLPSLRF